MTKALLFSSTAQLRNRFPQKATRPVQDNHSRLSDTDISSIMVKIKDLPSDCMFNLKKIYEKTFPEDIRPFVDFVVGKTIDYRILQLLTGMGLPLFLGIFIMLLPTTKAALSSSPTYNNGPSEVLPSTCNAPISTYAKCTEVNAQVSRLGNNNLTTTATVQFSNTISQPIDVNCVTKQTPASCSGGYCSTTTTYTEECNSKGSCEDIAYTSTTCYDGTVSYSGNTCAQPMTDDWFTNCVSMDSLQKNVFDKALNESTPLNRTNSLLCMANKIGTIQNQNNQTTTVYSASLGARGLSEKECTALKKAFSEFGEICKQQGQDKPSISNAQSAVSNMGYHVASLIAAHILKAAWDHIPSILPGKKHKMKCD